MSDVMPYHDGAAKLQDDDVGTRRKRALFRCWHRGTQEIDLIFGGFAQRSLAGFSASQLVRFEALLDCDDTDLFEWVTGQSAPPPAHDHDVMQMLRCSHSGQTKG